MTLQQLEFVLVLDTYRNLSSAAEACFVSANTLRKHLLRLENELGILLFNRENGLYTPTPTGTLIIEQARTIIHELKKVRDIIQDELEEPVGELKVGIIPTLAQYLFPFFLENYSKKYPKVNLYFDEILTDEIVARLRAGSLDVGICSTPLKLDGIIENPLFFERFLLYASEDHIFFDRTKIKLNEISLDELWLLQKGNTFRQQVLMLLQKKQQNSETSEQLFERSSIENLKMTIESQYGVTILPELATYNLNQAQQRHVKEIISPRPIREVSLITHQSNLKIRLAETLKSEIIKGVPKKMLNENRGMMVPVRF